MEGVALIFKALGDDIRLEIVKMLIDKELCVCDILAAFDKSQPAISHHLKVLKQSGIVVDKRDGKWVYYQLNPEAFNQVEVFLQLCKTATNERYRTCSPN
ncbi:ArsR/SmtB family transcription factor [Pelosinus fermentans]|uniref:Transcriptional regulator, ArsR family n=1 Tax=Pelosinus fermentans JBW45 TaxID=1192197 RepID=I8U5H7_9FIRM|nr:metalloregulator ArsR/SmtB family transcription factor [Pelosinus fermentans]AJQ26968.1 transcriptional regulator, ArsR family [Pelosinus fermentans JBW45]